jgi:hypothetical protein
MLTAVISLAGRGDPDSMNAARNSPSVSPPFVTIWSDAEIEPALSPQLKAVSGLPLGVKSTHMVTFDGSPPKA